jgi:CspA family cold shock protein
VNQVKGNGKEHGIVKWFNDNKGFGFIGRPADSDVFVHHTDITGQHGRRTLYEGQEVEFHVVQGAKGLKATDVIVV